jgi:hypothetical protein
MHIDRRLVAALMSAGLLVGCGSADDSGSSNGSGVTVSSTAVPDTTTTVASTTTVAATTSTMAVASTDPPTTEPPTQPPTTEAGSSTSTSGRLTAEPIALWPAPDKVLATPEEAARDFVANAFAPGPVIGDFRPGEQGSGEIDVFAGNDAGLPLGPARSTLKLRQLGAAKGWFVIGATSNVELIATPEAGGAVPAGPLVITGAGQGFEANIGVSAFVVGKADPPLDETSTLAGNFGVPLPYEVTLDLSGAAPGDTVVLLVHAGVGLETDPGDFSAIAITIAS